MCVLQCFYSNLVVKQIVNHSNEIDVKIRHKKNVNLLLKIVINV